ncbi:MAG: hypothetical protein ABI171_00775 [Collimonas sp.]|uniref:hypothetical protein n=1 Tax=Collimonas sp. TaxID=1963772 RepID=UPI00326406D4
MITIRALVIVILAAVLVALAGSGGSYLYGHSRGVDDSLARANADTVQNLTEIIESHQVLIGEANAASKAMREALDARAAQDSNTTRELKNVLAKTATRRVDCHFDDDVMRILTAARERAAAAAAGGVRQGESGAGGTGKQ